MQLLKIARVTCVTRAPRLLRTTALLLTLLEPGVEPVLGDEIPHMHLRRVLHGGSDEEQHSECRHDTSCIRAEMASANVFHGMRSLITISLQVRRCRTRTTPQQHRCCRSRPSKVARARCRRAVRGAIASHPRPYRFSRGKQLLAA